MSGAKLYEASGNGDVDAVRSLLKAGASPQLSDDDLGTALIHAASKGQIEIVKILLEPGSAPFPVNLEYAGVALSHAASEAHREVVAILLEELEEISDPPICIHLAYAIMHAASENKIEALKVLLKERPTYHLSDYYIGGAIAQAASKGRVEAMKILLELDPTVDEWYSDYLSGALSHAASEGHIEVLSLLLGALRKAKAPGTWLSLVLAIGHAASENRIEALKILLKEGFYDGGRSLLYAGALNRAASKGHLEAVKLLLEEVPSLDCSRSFVPSALTDAASGGYIEVTKILLEAGLNIELEDGFLRPALQGAASKGYIQAMKIVFDDMKIVNILLGAGEDVGSSNDANEGTPLDIASRFGLTKVVKILSEAGADFDVLREHLQAVPHHTFNGHFEVMKLLVEAGEEIDTSNEATYETALHIASRFGLTQVVKALIKEGANVNDTSVLAAVSEGHIEIVSMLLKEEDDRCMREKAFLGAIKMSQTEIAKEILKKGNFDLNAMHDHDLALEAACHMGQIEIVKLILEEKTVEIDPMNRSWRTPLSVACEGGHLEIVELLLEHKVVNTNCIVSCLMPSCLGCCKTALSIARERGNYEIAQLLYPVTKVYGLQPVSPFFDA